MQALENVLYPIVVKINEYLSSYILIVLLIAVGLWYTIETRFVQIRYFRDGMKKVFGNLSLRGGKQQQGMSSFQALTTAIAAQVGTVQFHRFCFRDSIWCGIKGCYQPGRKKRSFLQRSRYGFYTTCTCTGKR